MNILNPIIDICKSIHYTNEDIEFELISGNQNSGIYLLSGGNPSLIVKFGEDLPNHFFNAELNGLELIRKTNTFRVPNVIETGVKDKQQFIVLEYLEYYHGKPNWIRFGELLAKMHLHTNTTFGLDSTNFISKLNQSNTPKDNWISFYFGERILPQIELAQKNGFLGKIMTTDIYTLESWLTDHSSEIKPSLLHGDLWNGNARFDISGMPVLIDPSVYYGDREIDLAMMHLFGGFPQETFEAYNRVYPLNRDWENRISLYQLYPVLVHINLFGRMYEQQALRIIESYQ